MKKFYSIEYLRVWFLIIIIMCHTSMVSGFSNVHWLYRLLRCFGSNVDIFFVLCGFFLYAGVSKIGLVENIKKRIKRIIPALVVSKLLYILLLGYSGSHLLSDLFMLNANIGISVPTISHILWYVDVMFWVYLFYVSLFGLFERKKSLFTVAILTFVSLMLLFMNEQVGLKFQLLPNSWIDGGLLRGFAFMGMGILLCAIPNTKQEHKPNRVVWGVLELLSLIMAFLYPAFSRHDSVMVLNHVLWAVVFVFLMTREYGFVSRWLNKQSGIWHISKYCYEIYVFQLFAITLGQKWFSPHQAPILTMFGILVLSVVFGKCFKDYVEPVIFKLCKKI